MPRQPRIEFAGAAYHVMCRGDRQERIFLSDADRKSFLDTLEEVCERTGWRIHAYVLMSNHYHALIQTPEPNLVAGMRWFQGTYTTRFNRRNRMVGHLFQGRYKALLVDAEEEGYFLQVSRYIHLNPARAGQVDLEQGGLEQYRWSSYPSYLSELRKRPGYLCVDSVLGELGLEDTPKGRRAYRSYLEDSARRVVTKKERKEFEEEWKPIRRGWCLGSERFRERMGALLEEVLTGSQRSSFSGQAAKAHDERRAEVLLDQGLSAVGLSRADLRGLRKSDARKQALAWWIGRQTTVKNRWLSERLHMGHESNASKAIQLGARRGGRAGAWRRKLESLACFKD